MGNRLSAFTVESRAVIVFDGAENFLQPTLTGMIGRCPVNKLSAEEGKWLISRQWRNFSNIQKRNTHCTYSLAIFHNILKSVSASWLIPSRAISQNDFSSQLLLPLPSLPKRAVKFGHRLGSLWLMDRALMNPTNGFAGAVSVPWSSDLWRLGFVKLPPVALIGVGVCICTGFLK